MKIKTLAFTLLAFTSLHVMAQETVDVTGTVLDKMGNPISGAAVSVLGAPANMVSTDVEGKFVIVAAENDKLYILAPDDAVKTVEIDAKKKMTIVMDLASQKVNYGFGLNQTFAESTGSAATVYNDKIDNRSAFSMMNSLYGNVPGLVTMQNPGLAWDQTNSFSIRGLKTLNGNNDILVVIDGMERDNSIEALAFLTPEEVESVTILRDAAAIALYGYRGVNGVLNIVTKRGKHQTREINFSYDHGFTYQNCLPQMTDAYTYAQAMNEAAANDGKAAYYTKNELNAFRTNKYPFLYPNVDWWNEVYRDRGKSDIATLTFRGGSSKLRYYTLLNLQNGRGFIANADVNKGYSVQDKYSKGNVRTNLDVTLTSTTTMQVNVMGMLNEYSLPGGGGDLLSMLYTVPSAAFPIRNEKGLWGGNATWTGEQNPVALALGSGYSKGHTLGLWSDLTLKQDLSSIIKGLGASFRLGYDKVASYREDHTKDYKYGSTSVTGWVDGVPSEFDYYEAGADSEMAGGSQLHWQYRSFNFRANVDWNGRFADHKVYTNLMYSYKYDNNININSTLYNMNWSWYTHYGYKDRYFMDLALVMSGSNRLQPGEQWNLSPTVGLAWNLKKENLLKDVSWIDFLKLRTSFGIIKTDNIPANGYWNITMTGGSGYPIQDDFDYSSSWQEGRLPSLNGTVEKAYKFNVGIDATLFGGLTLMVDGFYERRKDIWVSTSGKFSSVLGASNSYANAGVVDSKGVEIAADYSAKIGDVRLNLGGNFSFARNIIKEQLEAPRAYDYLNRTGKRVGQVFGYQAIGYFIDQADIDNSPKQQFGDVEPGDVKYKDQNGDKVINEFDQVAMGYNSSTPEIYYGFNIGAEWKGIGFNAFFQGVGNYSLWTTLDGMYSPLVGGNAISEHYYNNRWTPITPNARYPRLSAQAVQNNRESSSVWLENGNFLKLRNCEVYYKLPHSLISKWHLNTAKVYVRGVGLFCWDHINVLDPESLSNGTPTTRSINVGLSIGF